MTDAPDQVWIDARRLSYCTERAAACDLNDHYLRATPARLNAEELVEVLQEIVDDLPWLTVAMSDWDVGGKAGVFRLIEIAVKLHDILARIERKK